MISELKPCEACNGTGEGGLNAVMDIFCRRCKGLGTRAVPDVPELVTVAYLRTTDQKAVSLRTADHHTDIVPLVLHSQAAEIIAAKDKEIERLKDDSRITFDKYLDAHNENVTLKAELAQYEAQEPIGYLIGDGHFTMSEKQAEIAKSCTTFTVIPLYASPAPDADLKAERDAVARRLEKALIEGAKNRLRCEELEGLLKPFSEAASLSLISGSPPSNHIDASCFMSARNAINVEASNDKG